MEPIRGWIRQYGPLHTPKKNFVPVYVSLGSLQRSTDGDGFVPVYGYIYSRSTRRFPWAVVAVARQPQGKRTSPNNLPFRRAPTGNPAHRTSPRRFSRHCFSGSKPEPTQNSIIGCGTHCGSDAAYTRANIAEFGLDGGEYGPPAAGNRNVAARIIIKVHVQQVSLGIEREIGAGSSSQNYV